jgi:D-alanyl-D-alanine carboxypeptidase
MRPVIIVAASALLLAACSSGDTAGETPSESPSATQQLPADVTSVLQNQLTKTMERNGVPGGVVQICAPGYENWADAQGVADRETGEEMTTDLVWPIRSVTKSFTVTLILQLVDEGKISLDDTINQWVPNVPNGDEITLAQLADMSSGVPEYTTQEWLESYIEDSDQAYTDEQLIEYALAEPAQFKPGAEKVYINTSTLLLGQVVVQEYGQPFGEVVQEQILDPLGLSATTYTDSVNDWTGPHPTGNQPVDGQLEDPGNNFTALGAAGAMTSTLDDLCKWGDALGQGTLLEAETQEARLQGAPLDKGPEYDIYAQGIGSLEGWYGHTGEGFGHTVLVMHNAESGTTAVVGMNLSNAGKHVPTRYFRKVAPTLDSIPPAG